MIIHGEPGLGKTRIAKQVLPETAARWIKGKGTAYGLFQELQQHIDAPFVLDDNDDLYRDEDMIKLLKQLGQSEESKTVSWLSKGTKKDEEKPSDHTFETRSPLLIIVNDWQRINKHVGAVMDRGYILRFDPTKDEVHEYVGEWFERKSGVYDWIGANLSLASNLSVRHYIHASREHDGGFNWKKSLLDTWNSTEPLKVVLRLAHDRTLKSEEVRAHMFEEATGLSRRTYFRIKRQLDLTGSHRRTQC